MLYEATSVADPESHKSETKISEPAQSLTGVDLQYQNAPNDDIDIQKL